MVKYTKKHRRGGAVSIPDVDKAVETANDLMMQLKAIQTSAETDTYGLESSVTPSEPSVSSSLDMSDYGNEPDMSSSVSSGPAITSSTEFTIGNTQMPVSQLISVFSRNTKNPGDKYGRMLSLLNNPGTASYEDIQSQLNASKIKYDDFTRKWSGGIKKTKKNKLMKKRRGKKTMRH
jgi:hypothetical protein